MTFSALLQQDYQTQKTKMRHRQGKVEKYATKSPTSNTPTVNEKIGNDKATKFALNLWN